MSWFYLLLAGLLEIIWAYTLKLSNGFTRIDMTAVTIVTALLSFILLSYAMKSLPLGTAYAIWTGIGIIGSFIIGILFLGESMHWLRILSVVLVVVGIIGLKLSSLQD